MLMPTQDTEAQSRVMFHGNGRNRWFDKSVQLAILANGVAGSNVEHTPIDATVRPRMQAFNCCKLLVSINVYWFWTTITRAIFRVCRSC